MADFPFKVGDKVRTATWREGDYTTITAIGVRGFLAVPAGVATLEQTYHHHPEKPWELYVPPPVRRRWTFETEDREVTEAERIMYVVELDRNRRIRIGERPRCSGAHAVIVPGTLREVE